MLMAKSPPLPYINLERETPLMLTLEVLDVPQHSRMFLSFIKLNCNLGRTQSHSPTQTYNRYSTYRTLSDMLTKNLAVDSYLISLGNMYLTSNLQVLHVYDGTIG